MFGEVEEISPEALNPMSLNEVEEVLDATLKQDRDTKILVFLCMLMNYCGDDQQNILFNAPSSTGKSYTALEIARLFPREDVEKKGYTSPTSFFHTMGKLCTLDGNPLEDRAAYVKAKLAVWEETHTRPVAAEYEDTSPEAVASRRVLSEWKKKRDSEAHLVKNEWDALDKIYVVSLEKRILIFKDQPHDRVLQVLRSLLSHDEKILEVDITDKTREGGHRTKKIRVVGYPTIVFCSAQFSLDEQERTRFWILSPEMSQKKLSESLKLQAVKMSHKSAFQSKLDADGKRKLLTDRIKAIKKAQVKEIIIPEPLTNQLLEWFKAGRDWIPRDQRDFSRLLDIVRAHTLFNLFQRTRTGDTATANEEDVEAAKKLSSKIMDANHLGLPPYIYRFYTESIKPAISENGISRETLSQLYFSQFKERLGEKARKHMIDLLSEAGLIIEHPDPDDKRKTRIYIPLKEGEKKNFLNTLDTLMKTTPAYQNKI